VLDTVVGGVHAWPGSFNAVRPDNSPAGAEFSATDEVLDFFDEADRLDKVDEGNVVAITRTVVRIIESTRDTSAAQLRTGLVASGP
jgi:hypothetical protein